MGQSFVRKPLCWNEQGKVLSWNTKASGPVKTSDGKIAMHWTEVNGGRVLLWAYTLPPKILAFVRMDDLTSAQKKKWENGWRDGGMIEAVLDSHYLGRIAKMPREWREIMGMVDDTVSAEAHLAGNTDRWGHPPQLHMRRTPKVRKAFADLRSFVCKMLGDWLWECMNERDGESIAKLADVVKEAKRSGLSFHWHSWRSQGIWHDTESFQGTVLRCWEVLRDWKGVDYLPTKAALRTYVLQEWEAMGHTGNTVRTEFSATLKRLGLSGLPNAARGRSVVTVRRSTLQK